MRSPEIAEEFVARVASVRPENSPSSVKRPWGGGNPVARGMGAWREVILDEELPEA